MAGMQHAGDYNLKSFLLSSHNHKVPIDLTSHVDEFEIFENIGNPYLTGSFVMKDDMRFYDGVDINGTEIIEIVLESPRGEDTITKMFSLVSVNSTIKSADNTEALDIKIVENKCFNNN